MSSYKPELQTGCLRKDLLLNQMIILNKATLGKLLLSIYF